MKNTLNTEHPDLMKVEGSLANTLSVNKDIITAMYDDPDVSLQEMKSSIKDVIMKINGKDAANKSVATKRLLQNLDKQYTKAGTLQLVWNTMMKGANLGVI